MSEHMSKIFDIRNNSVKIVCSSFEMTTCRQKLPSSQSDLSGTRKKLASQMLLSGFGRCNFPLFHCVYLSLFLAFPASFFSCSYLSLLRSYFTDSFIEEAFSCILFMIFTKEAVLLGVQSVNDGNGDVFFFVN